MAPIPTAAIYAVSFGITGLVVYLIARYGAVEHSWVKLEKGQLLWLKENHARQRASAPGPPEPGRVLYSRRLVGHEGLRVHERGLYAKFCLGQKGKYRFVPFTAITGIYPVRFDNPFAGQMPSWATAPAQWRGLQIETADYLVAVVDSRKHDLALVEGLLQRGLGPRWPQVWRPANELRTNFHEGPVYVHAALRPAQASAPPSTLLSSPSAGTTGPPVAAGKGALLLEEDRASIEARRAAYLKGGLVLAAIGAGLLALGLAALLGLMPRFVSFAFTMVGLLFGPLSIGLATLLLVGRDRMTPIRLHENGVEARNLLGTPLFVSWGEVLTATLRSNPIDGETLFFQGATLSQSFGLPRRLRGLDAVVETVRPRFGKPEYVVRPPPDAAQSASAGRVELGFHAVGIALALGGTVILLLTSFPAELAFWGFVLLFPPLGMAVLTFITHRLRSNRAAPQVLRVKIPAAMVAGLLAFFLGSLFVGGAFPTTSGPAPVPDLEARPAATGLAPGSYADQSLTVDGTVRVDAGETLTLVNTTLILNITANRQAGVWVGLGARLVLENATVRSAQPIYRYWFEIQGSAVIRNSMIRDLWGDADDASRDHTDGGLEIASSDVTIEGSRIYATGTNGILVINADPRILNTTVANAGDDGIDLQNADPYLYNVTVTDARWAMILMHGSDATIESSRIVDNDHGIFSEDSRPTIRNSTFERNGPYAIRFAGSGRPVLSGNTFVREEDDIEDDTFPVLQVCTGVVALLGAGCLVFLYSIHRAQKVKAAGPPRAP